MTDDHPITPDEVTPALEHTAAAPGADPSGVLGGLDMGSLFEQAAKVQEQMLAAQQEAAETVIEGVAGGGAVRIEVTGALEFQSVTIAPAAVDPGDVEMLQDLVLAALHDAIAQVNELQQGSLDLGGLDLGGLLGG
ncbi:MAG: YbaB/EbfC family nucleoid-associated protein [Acidimicrobiales bacterium]|nr:YbaB/EbfC family nucleoid-associated protein [Acidimicrobiales bacterium]